MNRRQVAHSANVETEDCDIALCQLVELRYFVISLHGIELVMESTSSTTRKAE
jgi:hypothetical protein